LTQKWRLLDTQPCSAAENMALDEVILEARSRDWIPNTLRFLQFSPPCTLVGYHQAVEQEVRPDYCQDHGIEINRRITGGGGLFWDESQLGWEIYAPRDYSMLPKELDELYAFMCRGAELALAEFGVKAEFRPKNDIEVDGRKISGTGGTELDGIFLFQGTLLVDFDIETMLRALRIPTEKLKDKEIESVKERVTCLRWALGAAPPLAEIKAAFVRGFANILEAEFEPGSLTALEANLLAEKLPYFQSPDWVYGPQRYLPRRHDLRALRKTPGGLLRASLVVDRRPDRLKSVLLTGDFFAYPKRAVMDLEARLKNTSADKTSMRRTVEKFFATSETRILGVTPDDIASTIDEALSHLEFERYGLDPAQANNLFTVGLPFDRLPRPKYLLLPYCAKLAECEYRYRDGCVRCGQCSIGAGYDLAERYGLEPITIQNYEMLEDILTTCRNNGGGSFVGSCCEPFVAKHRDDFDRIGLPGVLVDLDSSTCYDLGQQEQAYRGRYENQTELRLSLLEQVLVVLANRPQQGGTT
jgi:lipoate---protein ligase